MVALLHQGLSPEREHGRLAARVDARPRRREPLSSRTGSRPGLRLVVDQAWPPDGSVAEAGQGVALRPVASTPASPSIGGVSVAAVVVIGVVVFGLLGLVRGVQAGGGFASGDAAGETGSVSVGLVDAVAGDRLVVVGPGDSLWSIASELAPDRDPRPLVEALAEVNGGTSLQVGQQIVIPGSLLE